ncbi:MAG: bifunctional phosphoribosyl-AMP cyclohydrolase/phosphoribosyl-ATP diphosphatase HisIE [Chloroflexi bacterium]|nr:bifunctional phosphoribosyl-AMP cyclohydrolase/phosphoribosyl-ATP diphosphatase HisIE [Chloroflexota bacterium]
MLDFVSQPLIPAIVQDARTGVVLMLAYMNAEALAQTLQTGDAWFYSRSRKELWHKGETSGNYLRVRGILADCDGDAILLQVEPAGPACHTGKQSCFFQRVEAATGEPGYALFELPDEQIAQLPSRAEVLAELFEVIEGRKRELPEGSYVASLFKNGIDRISKKVIEEAGEAVIAAKNNDRGETIYEVADLWFHSLVLLSACGLSPKEIWEELSKRRR